jgi:2-aminoadipate transaminase
MSADTGFADLFAKGLPDPSPRFAGLPKYNFVGGHGDPRQVPVEELARAASNVLMREGDKLAWYGMSQGPQGYLGLRQFVCDKLGSHRAIKIVPDDVLITSGSGQSLELINRVFINPGDTVIVEELTYGAMVKKIRAAGAKIVGLPLDEQGLRTDALENILKDLKAKGVRAKYIYTIPTLQNPTGSVLPLERRQQTVALARAYGVPIFEDECYADLVWTLPNSPPALYALDPANTIHIGSFSKTLGPALRVGYAVASWEVLSRMIGCRTDGVPGAIDQMVVAEYFRTEFDAHIKKLTGTLREKHDVLIEALAKEFGTAVEITPTTGGIYLWVKLPDAVDVTKLFAPAAKAGVAFNPGPEWACDPNSSKSHMRLCYALPSKDEIREGVAQLARVCFEQTGIPARSGNVARA